jgi:hypothetical protein
MYRSVNQAVNIELPKLLDPFHNADPAEQVGAIGVLNPLPKIVRQHHVNAVAPPAALA